ncbi:hypothetical protein NIES2101_38465 [Calothrix sp. HK-06]|nr:hypothetical protein NIES2101_38465 [Calothrix sp. HK-06]
MKARTSYNRSARYPLPYLKEQPVTVPQDSYNNSKLYLLLDEKSLPQDNFGATPTVVNRKIRFCMNRALQGCPNGTFTPVTLSSPIQVRFFTSLNQ